MMKTILLLITLLTAGCMATKLPPAAPATIPMDKANVILIYTDQDAETAYRTIAQLLTDDGFNIENSDPMLMNLSTGWKQTKMTTGQMWFSGESHRLKVNASVRDGEQRYIKLTGLFEPAMDNNKTVRDEGGKQTYTQRSWRNMIEVAERYPNGRIMYARD